MIGLALALAGCIAPHEVITLDPCLGGERDGDTRVFDVRLHGAAGEIDAQLRFPLQAEARTLPVVVQVFGGWDDALEPQTARLGPDEAVSVRVALSGPDWGDGASDLRGPQARAAVAAALEYARGLTPDVGACRLGDRARPAAGDVVLLLGLSNGGNLALATLADAALDAPAPDGVITWETPVGAQLVNLEHRNSPGLYAPGGCTLDALGLHCPFLEPALLVADGGLCFDLDDDLVCAPDELARVDAVDPATGRFATSAELLALARAAGTVPASWDLEEESAAFWAVRDAALAAPAVLERHPGLPFLLVGSEVDHVLTGLSDHPHLYALGQALQQAGAPWVRLNPGAAWSGLATENPINAELRLDSPVAWLVAEADEAPLDGLLDAAVGELTDRLRTGELPLRD